MKGKTTYASLFGIGGSMEVAGEYTKKAIASLQIFGEKAEPLIWIANNMLNRNK